MRRIWDIHGGVHPPENKHQSTGSPAATIPLADELILPLNQHIGAAALPSVKVGDKVLKGQKIADAQGIFSAALHAPTSGTIVALEDRVIAHPSGLTAPCLVLRPDGEDQWIALQPCEDPAALDHFQLVERIREAGLAGMGGAGFPTAVKLNPRSIDKVETLILNGTECEPYITADDTLMRYHAAEVVQGALLLGRIVGKPKEILIGLEDNKPEAIAALRREAAGTAVEIVVFPTKYPSGGEKQLIQILTGKEVPSGKIPAQIGVLVQNVGTAYAAWRAVRYGEPLVDRITTVVGESLQLQRNVRVPLGTPIGHLLQCHGFNSADCARLIIGGPMMGYSVDDLQVPVVKTTNCVLVPSHREMPPAPAAQACIRCGICAEACPANLLPQQLYWYAQAQDVDKLQAHNLFDCIECGACSFVCPSAIPLVQYYRAAKSTIRHQEADKNKSDRARQRFEQRQARIAQAEADKEAKRAARKLAAEQAKQKLAVEAADTKAPATPAATTAVTSAATPSTSDPSVPMTADADSQGKKLARALSSAESRLGRVQQQIASCADQERLPPLQAQLKQAQLKVDEAQQKLDDFARGTQTPLDNRLAQMAEKHLATPLEAQQKALETLQKRLDVAIAKVAEAEREQKPTLAALQQGVEKLRTKLAEAEAELAQLQSQPAEIAPAPAAADDPAAAAIARAQAKAASLAEMSDTQRQAEQLQALQARIAKAEAKLAEARAAQSDHVDALQTGLDKLRAKLAQLQPTGESPASDNE